MKTKEMRFLSINRKLHLVIAYCSSIIFLGINLPNVLSPPSPSPVNSFGSITKTYFIPYSSTTSAKQMDSRIS